MSDQIDVFPPHGFVRLVDFVGDELSIANAARVSFHKESTWASDPTSMGTLAIPGTLNEADTKLIGFLLRNKHGTPFEQGFMSQWHIRVPIFVMREWVRHRIGVSINEESGRYVELRPDFYYPEVEAVRTQVGRPGHYTFEPMGRGEAEYVIGQMKLQSQRAFDLYRHFLDLDVAKEVARMVLPLNIYTEFRWTANARSLMNFFALRNSPSAMFEIRAYAQVVEKIFAEHMPNVHAAFIEAERVAP